MTLACKDVSHSFASDSERVLESVSLACQRGEACALMGPSGSGKTTLLCILGCLLRPASGNVLLDGSPVDYRCHQMLTQLRREQVGFVFQHAQLIPFLTAEENCAIIGRNAAVGQPELQSRIDTLFDRLGIAGLLSKKPDKLSGGERQRVAIARALVHRPAVVLADEPTAALDWTSGRAAVEMLVERAKQQNAVLITVTHDARILSYFDRVLRIDSGRLVEE